MKKVLFGIAASFFPLVCSAHGVGQVYALPIPLRYYLGSAGTAVALSFFIFAYFLNSEKTVLPTIKNYTIVWLKPVVFVLKIITLFFFVLMILTGIFGFQNANSNFAPIFFWVYFLLGFGILSLFIGNIWDKLNPWKFLVDILGLKKGKFRISSWLGVTLVMSLYWFELSSGLSFVPKAVGGFLLLYTIINLFLSTQFENWFEDGELFSVFFGFIGKLAYFQIGEDNKNLVYLPLRERLTGVSLRWSDLGLAAVLLAGTSFDSFKETTIWFGILNKFGFGHATNFIFPDTIGLLLSPIPFVLVYLFLMWLMEKMTYVADWRSLTREFIPSLIPIAFGYTLAHNFSLVIVTVPKILGLLSDPFGFGWNILRTSALTGYSLILGAKPIWFIEIGFVVTAHIIATLFAHLLAVQVMPNPKKVLISQYPTLILMVAFTITTLWLLSQPLVISK